MPSSGCPYPIIERYRGALKLHKNQLNIMANQAILDSENPSDRGFPTIAGLSNFDVRMVLLGKRIANYFNCESNVCIYATYYVSKR